MMLFVVF